MQSALGGVLGKYSLWKETLFYNIVYCITIKTPGICERRVLLLISSCKSAQTSVCTNQDSLSRGARRGPAMSFFTRLTACSGLCPRLLVCLREPSRDSQQLHVRQAATIMSPSPSPRWLYHRPLVVWSNLRPLNSSGYTKTHSLTNDRRPWLPLFFTAFSWAELKWTEPWKPFHESRGIGGININI